MNDTPNAPAMLPDGVYIGLSDAEYFAQDRQGSTDQKTLAMLEQGWWWQSRHNPFYEPPKNDAYTVGHAAHAILLEGIAAYQDRFVIEPDKRDFKNVLCTIAEMKAALIEEGAGHLIKSAWRSADYVAAVQAHLWAHVAWDAVLAEFEERRGAREALSKEDDFSMRTMYDAAMSDADVCEVLGHSSGMPILAEVTYFWTDETGRKRRAKFDKFTPADTIDVKTLANWQKRDLTTHTGGIILFDGLSVQVADQHEARKRLHAQVQAEGEACIFGGTDEQRTWLQAIAIANKPWNWVWLFYQKPDRKAGLAPVIFPVRDEWGSKTHREGLRLLKIAADAYAAGVAKFGLDKPWYRVEPVHTTNQHRERAIMLPEKGWQMLAIDNEEEALSR